MKRIRLLLILAGAAALMAAVSCKKQSGPSLTIGLSVDVTDVTAVNAVMDIAGEGDTPTLVRMVSPVPQADVLEEIGSLDNAEAVRNYISSNGVAIDLPYHAVLRDLNPETAYFTGVVAFDANMDIFGYATATFTTKDLASLAEDALGDPSDAGSLTENVLE